MVVGFDQDKNVNSGTFLKEIKFPALARYSMSSLHLRRKFPLAASSGRRGYLNLILYSVTTSQRGTFCYADHWRIYPAHVILLDSDINEMKIHGLGC